MAKIGGFAAVPDGLFGRLINLYGTFDGAGGRPGRDVAVVGLTAMAKAAQASASPNLDPNIIEVAIVCVQLENDFTVVTDPASTPAQKQNALLDIPQRFIELEGLWRE
jgi:hypothetical protein